MSCAGSEHGLLQRTEPSPPHKPLGWARLLQMTFCAPQQRTTTTFIWPDSRHRSYETNIVAKSSEILIEECRRNRLSSVKESQRDCSQCSHQDGRQALKRTLREFPASLPISDHVLTQHCYYQICANQPNDQVVEKLTLVTFEPAIL